MSCFDGLDREKEHCLDFKSDFSFLHINILEVSPNQRQSMLSSHQAQKRFLMPTDVLVMVSYHMFLRYLHLHIWLDLYSNLVPFLLYKIS